MNIVIIYAESVIASAVLSVMAVLQIIKDLADTGYKIDSEALLNFNENVNKKGRNNNLRLFNIFVPVLNLLIPLSIICGQKEILKLLATHGLVCRFTDLEEEEYSQNKTLFHALKTPSIVKRRLDNALKIEFMFNNQINLILYEYDDVNDTYIILKKVGDIAMFKDEDIIGLLSGKNDFNNQENTNEQDVDELTLLYELRRQLVDSVNPETCEVSHSKTKSLKRNKK